MWVSFLCTFISSGTQTSAWNQGFVCMYTHTHTHTHTRGLVRKEVYNLYYFLFSKSHSDSILLLIHYFFQIVTATYAYTLRGAFLFRGVRKLCLVYLNRATSVFHFAFIFVFVTVKILLQSWEHLNCLATDCPWHNHNQRMCFNYE